MMKFLTYISLITCGFLVTPTLNAEEIVLTELSGKIAVKEPGEKKYKKIKKGDVVKVGSWVMTLNKTDATLTFYKTDKKKNDVNSTLKIGSYSKLKIDSFDAAKEKVTTTIKARAGHIVSNVDPEESKGNNYKVETPQVTAAVKGTTLEVITNSKMSKVKTIEGEVESSSDHGTKEVGANQETEVTKEKMSSSIDTKLKASQNTALYTGSSPAEAEFQNKMSLVPVGGDSSGQEEHSSFQSSNAETQSGGAQTTVPVCWEFFMMIPFPIFPPPPGCDPLPPPPLPPGP